MISYSLRLDHQLADMHQDSLLEEAERWHRATLSARGHGNPRRQGRVVGILKRLVGVIADHGRQLGRHGQVLPAGDGDELAPDRVS